MDRALRARSPAAGAFLSNQSSRKQESESPCFMSEVPCVRSKSPLFCEQGPLACERDPKEGPVSCERGPLSYERGFLSDERVPLSYECPCLVSEFPSFMSEAPYLMSEVHCLNAGKLFPVPENALEPFFWVRGGWRVRKCVGPHIETDISTFLANEEPPTAINASFELNCFVWSRCPCAIFTHRHTREYPHPRTHTHIDTHTL